MFLIFFTKIRVKIMLFYHNHVFSSTRWYEKFISRTRLARPPRQWRSGRVTSKVTDGKGRSSCCTCGGRRSSAAGKRIVYETEWSKKTFPSIKSQKSKFHAPKPWFCIRIFGFGVLNPFWFWMRSISDWWSIAAAVRRATIVCYRWSRACFWSRRSSIVGPSWRTNFESKSSIDFFNTFENRKFFSFFRISIRGLKIWNRQLRVVRNPFFRSKCFFFLAKLLILYNRFSNNHGELPLALEVLRMHTGLCPCYQRFIKKFSKSKHSSCN